MMKISPIDFKPELVINDENRTTEGFGLYGRLGTPATSASKAKIASRIYATAAYGVHRRRQIALGRDWGRSLPGGLSRPLQKWMRPDRIVPTAAYVTLAAAAHILSQLASKAFRKHDSSG